MEVVAWNFRLGLSDDVCHRRQYFRLSLPPFLLFHILTAGTRTTPILGVMNYFDVIYSLVNKMTLFLLYSRFR